jgi:hypothetical protein
MTALVPGLPHTPGSHITFVPSGTTLQAIMQTLSFSAPSTMRRSHWRSNNGQYGASGNVHSTKARFRRKRIPPCRVSTRAMPSWKECSKPGCLLQRFGINVRERHFVQKLVN